MLRSWKHGESDKIVSFLSRDFGKISGIAKGALRSRKRFVNALEPFTHVRLGFRTRSSSDLCFVESADIVRAPRKLGLDLDRYAYSTYVVELVDSMIEGREADAYTFELVEQTLERIDAAAETPAADWLRRFEVKLLTVTGFEPRLEHCSRCRRLPADDSIGFHFNPRTGTIACGDCSDGGGLSVSSAALRYVSALKNGAVEAAEAPSAGEVRVLLQTFINHHVRRPLRSPALLREILGR